ncbi:SusC/RagA family TonB-linked outer membrane protein [Marivirga lumbricoides]|uniref:SusC/RagA family TonB-linked outer membrane protein n=1 Tax=Marivirga lumbricoides TaxID=1046115 RepID=A0ABQ1N6A6_9BACT|nr:SusC/RagA family TonB-linked outer membrane protein [Marivirga lumbricoides]
MKNVLLTCLFVTLLVSGVKAQIKVSGTVTDAVENTPIPGVNILVNGTDSGTTTGLNGEYTIEAPSEDAVLVFSFIGYKTQQVKVANQSTLNVALQQDVMQLGEVVVTALGIEKEERGLTYSTQQLSGDELTTVKEQNMINSLAGKTAGLNITRTSGGVGASSRVLLRGNKSISGANQPLYVIDGIPMNSNNLGSAGGLYGAVDNGDAIANLNPEDIESVNVLKGASAAALYGSQAANGVILITTKNGKKGVSQVNFSSSVTFESPLLTPDLQSEYGQTAPGESLDTWGPKNGTASKDHVDDFFTTGSLFINSVSASSGNDAGQYYVSFARTDAKGIVPENSMDKNNFMARLKGTVFNNVTVDASANFLNQKIKNTPQPGFYNNPVLTTYTFPESTERFNYYKNNYEVYDASRNLYVQNYPYAMINQRYISDSPYWIVNRQPNDSWRNRGIYKLAVTVPIIDGLKVMGRVNLDRVDDKYEQRLYAGSSTIAVGATGDYLTRSQTSSQLYSDVLLTFDKELSDKFDLNSTIGFSNTYNHLDSLKISSIGNNSELYVPNLFSIQNLTDGYVANEGAGETLLQAAFVTATLGYNRMLYADFTLRNEWSSTLEVDNNDFLYPSAGLTFVLTELIGQSSFLSFAKLRGSYSEVGNALPFGVAFTAPRPINAGTFGAPLSSPIPGSYLIPERNKSTELGAKISFFETKLNLDLTWYNNRIEDQFFSVAAPSGSNVQSLYINGGVVRNRGIEAVLGYDVLNTGGLRYTTSVNFATNNNEVLEISSLLEDNKFIVTRYIDTKLIEIRVSQGGSYGDFYGKDYVRDENGNPIVTRTTDAEGNEEITVEKTADLVYMGNPNPDWQMGWQNAFSYKNWNFKFLIDGKFGGEVVSQTEAYLDQIGRTQKTADARNAGGVKIGNETVDAATYYKIVGGDDAPVSEYLYDATNIRLREIALGYTLPSNLLGGAIKKLTLSAIGRNLFFFKNDAPFDPEISAGSGNQLQGLNTFLIPSTRSYGFSLNATF